MRIQKDKYYEPNNRVGMVVKALKDSSDSTFEGIVVKQESKHVVGQIVGYVEVHWASSVFNEIEYTEDVDNEFFPLY
jgi:ribonuclease HI